MRKKWIAAGAVVAALAIGGSGAALAVGGGDSSVKGSTAHKAVAAALAATGGGTANAVERDGENDATYEVEVRKSDGSTVDVRLGADFHVIVIESDSEQGDRPDQGQQPEQGADAG
jgi:peptidase YpeB-like protein